MTDVAVTPRQAMQCLSQDQFRHLALGGPFIFNRRTYRLHWDGQYAGVYIRPLFDKGAPRRRDIATERAIAAGLPRVCIRQAVRIHVLGDIDDMPAHERNALKNHLLDGGVLRVKSDPLEGKGLTRSIALDSRGKLTVVRESRGLRWCWLVEFFRRLTVGRRQYREQQDQLSALQRQLDLSCRDALQQRWRTRSAQPLNMDAIPLTAPGVPPDGLVPPEERNGAYGDL